MNIFSINNLTSFSCYATSVVKEQILPSLTPQQRKIVLIASLAFACLVACYAMCYCWKIIKGSDGSVYEGKMIDGLLEGHGKITYVKGRIEEGEFANGKLHGQGKKIIPDWGVEEGKFKDGKIYDGKRIWGGPNHSDLMYEGQFENGIPEGKGKMTYLNGDSLQGVVQEGVFKGGFVKGKTTWPDGKIGDGTWSGTITWEGILTYPDGKVMEGNFIDDLLHGNGTITYPTGTVEVGFFKYGVRS